MRNASGSDDQGRRNHMPVLRGTSGQRKWRNGKNLGEMEKQEQGQGPVRGHGELGMYWQSAIVVKSHNEG